MAKRPAIWRAAFRLFRGAVLIAALTIICYRAGLNTASTALVFLAAGVLHSLDCTFFESSIISVLAVGCLDYFFIDPRLSLNIGRPLDAITLSCLLITSLIVTQLQARTRAEATASKRQREDMTSLYNVSQKLLSLDAGTAPGRAMLKTIQTEFDLRAICVFYAATLSSEMEGTSRENLPAKTRDAFITGQGVDYEEEDIVVRPLRAGGTIAGAIGLEGLPDPGFTADPLAALVAAVIGKNRAFQSAADAAAHAHAETLRSAIIDALAHEIKTPLATILTAAGGMRELGTMRPQQEELADLIESEASRLADLTSRLLRMGRLDSEEIKPRLERVSAAELAKKIVRRYTKLWDDRRFSYQSDADTSEVLADPELVLLALSQLLENACRYSPPEAKIMVKAASDGDITTITVQNEGAPIPPSEHNRIFDRFYRGSGARGNAPGSGLGLYVARKIIRAHGGDILLTDAGENAVAFRLSLPLAACEASVGTGDIQATDCR